MARPHVMYQMSSFSRSVQTLEFEVEVIKQRGKKKEHPTTKSFQFSKQKKTTKILFKLTGFI